MDQGKPDEGQRPRPDREGAALDAVRTGNEADGAKGMAVKPGEDAVPSGDSPKRQGDPLAGAVKAGTPSTASPDVVSSDEDARVGGDER